MNKEKLKNLLKDEFEECTEEESTINGFLKDGYLEFGFKNKDEKEIYFYFKPKQKFPIVFEGDNYNFKLVKIEDYFKLIVFSKENSKSIFFSQRDIEANQNALNKLKELRQ